MVVHSRLELHGITVLEVELFLVMDPGILDV